MWLFRQADVIVSGSFHVSLYARLANTPALFTQGNTYKAAELASEIDSPAYTFMLNADLVSQGPKQLADELHRLAGYEKQLLQADGVMARLRRLAMANVAPHGLADCIDTDALFPTIATIDVVREHEAFSRGGDARVSARNRSANFAWMGWGCGAGAPW